METYLKPSLEIIGFDRDDTILTSISGGHNSQCCTGDDLAANLYVIMLPELP